MAEMSFAPTRLRRLSSKKDENKIFGMLGISDPFDFLKGCTSPSKSAEHASEQEQLQFQWGPKKMLAAILTAYGPASNLDVRYCDLPQMQGGELGDMELCVEIHAASVNPTDCKARKGTLSNICPLKLPAILGIDFSGNTNHRVSKNLISHFVLVHTFHDDIFARPLFWMIRRASCSSWGRRVIHMRGRGIWKVWLTHQHFEVPPGG